MIRLTRKRLIVTAVVLILLTVILWCTWEACERPPIGMLLKYGLPSRSPFTGREWTSAEGVRFLELQPGYRHIRRIVWADKVSDLDLMLHDLGLDLGKKPRRSSYTYERWIEIPENHFDHAPTHGSGPLIAH